MCGPTHAFDLALDVLFDVLLDLRYLTPQHVNRFTRMQKAILALAGVR
jgi:hypothetical protein